jgi:peptide/nickel transport system substrate-binding protein
MTRRPLRALFAVCLTLALGLSMPARAQDDKPRRGGVLNWFDYGDPGRLDIHAESPLVVQQATAGIYSGLLHYEPDDPTKIVGDLAERWTASPDGKTYTFHLRRNVKWHDGAPFTAADVKATFDRLLNPDFKSPKCGASLKPMVASVEALDPYTVEVKLKYTAAPFIASVASAWCRVVARHVLAKFNNDLSGAESQIGTGPFKLKKYERGSVIEWERNPDYFLPGLPYLDGVKQFILVGGPTQLAAAKAGRLHLWGVYPPMKKSQADELKRARGADVDVYETALNIPWIIHMNVTKAPFNNADIRRAVNLAVDRQELVAKALEGAGVPCALLEAKLVGPFALPIDEVKRTPGCRQPKEEDIAEGKRLVAQHYPNGLDIEVSVRVVGNYVDRAQLVMAQLQKVGIRSTLRTLESAAGYAQFGRGDFTLIAAQDRAIDVNDPSSGFHIVWTTEAGSNYSKWSDPKVDELADRGLRETNAERRKQIYWELQRHILNRTDNGTIQVGWVEGWFFRDKKVRGFRPGLTAYDNNTFMKTWLSP